MLLSKKVDVYRKQDKVILQVSAGPGGWVSAIWSYCVKTERFELNVSLHSHGLTSLGSVSLRATHVSPQFLNHDSELTTLVHSPRAMLWHPSGERLVVIEGGRVFLFGVAWISKTRRNAHEIQTTHISMKRATEIYSDQLEEEDRTEQEGHITSHEIIGVRISLRQVSTHIGASAATVACTMFSDISGTQSTVSGTTHAQSSNNINATNVGAQKPPISTSHTSSITGTGTGNGNGGTHSVHNGRILVGTESGAVLSVAWGLPGDDINYTTNTTNTTNYNDLDHSNHSVYTTSTLSYTQHGDIHDVYDLEDEGRNRAHSYTNAGKLLATVVCAASNSISGVQPVYGSTTTSANNLNHTTTNNANTNNTIHSEEHRELLRIWQKPVFRLQALTNTPLNSLNIDNIPEVLDIGDVGTFVDNNATTMVEIDLNVSNHSSVHEYSHSKGGNSYKRVSYSATSVREIVCSDKNKCVVIVYGDGSFSVCMLVPVVVHVSNSSTTHSTHTTHTPHSTLTTPRTPHPTQHTPHSAQTTLPTTTIHTFVVHVSAKIHPVVLVAYPIPPTATVQSTNVSNGSGSSGNTSTNSSGKDDNTNPSADNTSQPDVYQLGSSGAYRSTTYTTSFDVEHTLDLSASLLQKVSRMRKLVTGRAEEEISRVLSVRVVYDTSIVHSSANSNGSSDNNGAIRVVALVQSKHMPALHSTYTTLRGEVLSVTRQESLSLVVYDVGLYSVDSSVSGVSSGIGNGGEGREIKCNVLHSICIDKNITTTYSTEPSLQLIHLPNVYNTHVLIHHADNRVSCRSMSDLYSVVFVVNPVPLSPSPSLTTVSVCMNRILLTVWDSHTHSSSVVSTAATPKHNAHNSTASTTHTHVPLYGTAKSLHLPTTTTTSSRIVVLPILTTVVNKVESQSALMYADLTEGTLHTIDIDASKCTPLSTVADTDTTHSTNTTTTAANATTATNTSTDDNLYTAPLLTTQLKLPRKLLTDITHYHTLCSVNNPFQPRSTYRPAQEGLLVVSSKQCREVVCDPVLYSKHGVSNTNASTNNSNISNNSTEYLAMIAGGSTVPYKHTTPSNTMTTTTTNTTTHSTYTNNTPTTTPTRRAPLLYVYNTTTHRWRGTYLIAGNRESSACLVKDIPTMQSVRKPEYSQLYGTSGSGKRYSAKLAVSVDSGSGSGKHHTTAANTTNNTTNATTLKSASVDSAHSAEHNTSPTISKSYKRRNSDNNITTTPTNATTTTINNTNSGKDINTGFSVRSLFSFNNNTTNNTNTNANNTITTYKRSISTPINARSQLAGSASSIVSLAWYGTHSIVLLTLRRSTYCIEVISREASKGSMSVGKLQPLVHKIIMLPPGYSPCSMECIVVSSNSSSNRSSDSNTSNVYNDHTPHTTNTIYEGNEYDSDTDSVSSENSLFNDTTNSAFSLQVPTPHSMHNSSVPGMHTPHSVRSVSSAGTTANYNTTSTTTSSGINGCVVVVSDNTTLLCYHIQAQGVYATSTSTKGSAKVTTNTSTNANNTSTNTSTSKGNTLQITDYHVTELWDTNLTTLALNESTTTNTSNTSNSTPGTNTSSINTSSNNVTTNTNNTSASVQFPVKDVKVFVQNIPLQEHQVEGYQRLSTQYHNSTLSGAPTFPVVSLYILDYNGSVYCVDAECNVCNYVCSNVSSISVLSSGDVCMNRVSDGNSGTSSGSTVVNSVIGEPLLLHTTHDPAADAQRHLLYIFTKTSLIQHIRPHALYTQHRLQYANTLHIPVNILVKHGVDKNSVHTFDESDLQRKRSRVYTHTGSVNIQLSTTHNTLLHTTQGLIVALGTKHVNISDFMRNRNHTTPITHDTNNGVLQFIPYLCTAFNNTLHNVVNSDETHTVTLHLHSSTDVPSLHILHTTLHTTLLHTLTSQLLHTARRSTTYTALLIAYLEHVVMQYTLAPNFNYKHTHYARLTQFMYSQDPTLLGEVLTRVGRKLEPAVSHLLFPVMVYGSGSEDTTAPHTTSILRLYESFLTTHHYHHAARVLSLACECIGGSESHISTTSALILALELLQCSVRSVSLRNSVECVDFCVRLESMLVMHSRAIFGESGSGSPRVSRKHVTNSTSSSGDTNSTTSINTRTLDNSYTSTVKSKALSLIHYTRDRVYRQTQHTIHTTRTNKDSVNSMQSVFTPTAAASPALPFYLGMGVGWILTKAVNSLIPETNNNSSNNSNNIGGHNGSSGNSGGSSTIQSGGTSGKSGKNGGSIGVGSSAFALNVNTTINTTNTINTMHSVYTSDDLLRQCMVPTASQVHTNNIALLHTTHTNTTSTNNTNTSSNSSVYQYSVIDTLEQKYGSVALSQMLVRTQLPPVYGSAGSSGGTSITPNTTAISPPNTTTDAVNTNNTIINNIGDQSPTALLLVHTLTDMFRSSTHYCNAAALLVALLQHGTSVQLLHHYLLTMHGNTGTTMTNSTDTTNSTSNSNSATSTNTTANTSSTGSAGAESSEKVRRILFVYRLNKVLSRTSLTSTTTIIHVPTPPTTNHTTTSTRNTIHFTHTVPTNNTVTSLLTQRVSAQYLRRVIEADSIHYAYNTTSYSHGMNSSGHGSPRYSAVNKANMGETPRATTVSGGGNSNGNSEQWSGERRAGYFELTEELLVHNRSAAGSGDSGSSGVNADSAAATTHTTHLTILTILKSLSVGLLLVGDSAAAGILLHTILPHIMHVDSVLYNVLLQLPRVSSVGSGSVSSSVSTGTTGTYSSGVGDSITSIGNSGPSGSDGENRQVWVLNTEQLSSLFNALVN